MLAPVQRGLQTPFVSPVWTELLNFQTQGFGYCACGQHVVKRPHVAVGLVEHQLQLLPLACGNTKIVGLVTEQFKHVGLGIGHVGKTFFPHTVTGPFIINMNFEQTHIFGRQRSAQNLRDVVLQRQFLRGKAIVVGVGQIVRHRAVADMGDGVVFMVTQLQNFAPGNLRMGVEIVQIVEDKIKKNGFLVTVHAHLQIDEQF